jgi:hypothetical protein
LFIKDILYSRQQESINKKRISKKVINKCHIFFLFLYQLILCFAIVKGPTGLRVVVHDVVETIFIITRKEKRYAL